MLYAALHTAALFSPDLSLPLVWLVAESSGGRLFGSGLEGSQECVGPGLESHLPGLES